MQAIRVPGVVWAALLVGLAWFLQTNWPGEPWLQVALIVISALLTDMKLML